MALPATSLTLPSMVTVYNVNEFRFDDGLKTAVVPEYVTDPSTLPLSVERVIVCAFTDDSSMASLNVIITEVLTETFCAPLTGLTELTVGAVVSEGGKGPMPPHPERTRADSKNTSIGTKKLFMIVPAG